MFPAALLRLTRPHVAGSARAQLARGETSVWAPVLRGMGLAFLGAGTLIRGASAQAVGTLQATARVVSGTASWAGLTEVRAAVEASSESVSAGQQVRRSGLLRTQAEVRITGGQRRVVVTVHHPRN